MARNLIDGLLKFLPVYFLFERKKDSTLENMKLQYLADAGIEFFQDALLKRRLFEQKRKREVKLQQVCVDYSS